MRISHVSCQIACAGARPRSLERAAVAPAGEPVGRVRTAGSIDFGVRGTTLNGDGGTLRAISRSRRRPSSGSSG